MTLFRLGPSSRTVAWLALACVAVVLIASVYTSARQQAPVQVPAGLSNIAVKADGRLELRLPGLPPFPERDRPAAWTLAQLSGSPRGTDAGIALDFNKPDFNGTLVFGLVPYHDTKFPQPVWRTTAPIKAGKAEIDIKARLTGTYDMVGWQKSGTGVVGYRLIASDGAMIYDGRVRFMAPGYLPAPGAPGLPPYAGYVPATAQGAFGVAPTLVEGPFLSNMTARQVVIWFELSQPASCSVTVGGRIFPCRAGATRQEILVDGLAPSTEYSYTVRYDAFEEKYGFRTAPRRGSRLPFTFAYASDSRGGQGGGDRNFNGPNAYVMRRLMGLAQMRKAAFVAFTGDLVGGNVTSPDAVLAELANWRRTAEPFWHWTPVFAGIGNHEAVVREFLGENNRIVRVDRFPYDTDSMEAVFASAMVNPENGPDSEDGAVYDPDPAVRNFPSYKENAYWLAWGNAALVVLNSNYWYTPTFRATPETGGNPHAYLMDNQMAWLAKTLKTLQGDPAIEHVFLTVHTPVFPNGGHVSDDMWYRGDNSFRPRVAGVPVAKGIIERRDELLTLIQKHPKVLAVLTGDEHNYNRLRLDATVPIYPDGWTGPRVTLRRPFHQINNGAAGAPYYAQEQTPWSAFVKGFSTQHALCFLQVAGPRVTLEVVNPETLEVLDRTTLR